MGADNEDVVTCFQDTIARRAEALLEGFDIPLEEVGPEIHPVKMN
jgi:hypothetical protein